MTDQRLNINEMFETIQGEGVYTGVPAVFVPFDDGGEVEQTLRARALSVQPGIEVLSATDLTPQSLMAEIKRVASKDRRSPSGLRMNGAAESVRIAQSMLAELRG